MCFPNTPRLLLALATSPLDVTPTAAVTPLAHQIHLFHVSPACQVVNQEESCRITTALNLLLLLEVPCCSTRTTSTLFSASTPPTPPTLDTITSQRQSWSPK